MNPTTRYRRIARYLGNTARIVLHATNDFGTHIARYNAGPISAPLQSVEVYNTHIIIIYEAGMKRVEYSSISRIFAYPVSLLPHRTETEEGFLLRLTLHDQQENEDIFFPYADKEAMCAIWSYLVS